jgi:hypothetical protein
MAGPASSALVMVAKNLVVDLFSDPENLFKKLAYLIAILLAIVLMLVLPLIILVSLPVILFNFLFSGGAGQDPAVHQAQLDTIAIYQDAPIHANNKALDWIEKMKDEYSWCDDIQVENTFDLTWQDVMAIDTVLLEQDFSNVSSDHVLDVSSDFLILSDTTETFEVEEEYEVEKEYDAVITYFNQETQTWDRKTVRKTRTVTRTRTVEKTRAILSVSTKDFYQVAGSMGFSAEEEDIASNIYTTLLQFDIEGQLNIYDDVDLSDLKEYPPGNTRLPYFNQTDKRWGAELYGSSGSIASAGCGPTALAMVVSGLTNKSYINPKTVADWSATNGHRAPGNGSYWSLMDQGGSYYGLSVENVSRRNPDRIVEALSNGYPVIVAMGRGHFTKGGHFIVLRGIDEDGKILVHDPASVSRSNKAWHIGIIMNESSTNGGSNGSPFWIFKP